jgi:hypothetical protein
MLAVKDSGNAGKIHQWHSQDNETNWINNSKKFGPTWRYFSEPIEYKFNSLGYRSPEPSNNKYFVAFGCSHTLGVGIHLDDTYCKLVADETKLDYLNFGLGGGSQNLLWTNNILLAKNTKKLPEFIILQWPETERINIFSENRINLFLPNHPGDNYTSKFEKNLYLNLLNSENYLYGQAMGYFESTNLLWKSLGIPVVNFTLSEPVGDLFDIQCFKGWTTDKRLAARDCEHPGPIHNKQFADYIMKIIKDNKIL